MDSSGGPDTRVPSRSHCRDQEGAHSVTRPAARCPSAVSPVLQPGHRQWPFPGLWLGHIRGPGSVWSLEPAQHFGAHRGAGPLWVLASGCFSVPPLKALGCSLCLLSQVPRNGFSAQNWLRSLQLPSRAPSKWGAVWGYPGNCESQGTQGH